MEILKNACSLAEGYGLFQVSVNVVAAQAAWHLGKQEVAQAQLLNSAQLSELLVVATLAAIGLVSMDQSLIDAALEEILDLAPDQLITNDPTGQVPRILCLNRLAQGNVQDAISATQRRIQLQPANREARVALAQMALWDGNIPLCAALVAWGSGELSQRLGILRVVAGAGSEKACSEEFKEAQKVVMHTPWNSGSWTLVSYLRALTANA